MGQTARDLVAHRSYNKPDGSTALTRKTTANQEWVFGAAFGNEFMIKFDKNFVKKHLFTYSKKTAEVGAIASQLWEAAGKPEGRDVDFWLAAELSKFDAKLTKVLKARAEDVVCTCGHTLLRHPCSGCGHQRARHFTGGGARCACKEPPLGSCGCAAAAVISFGCGVPGCACAAFANTAGRYAAKRTAVGKGDNPLAGASTQVNTCLVLDRVAMSDFKSVVISAIAAKETPTFTWPVIPPAHAPMPPVPGNYNDPAVKHVRWDFGASHLGCVIKADLNQDSSLWVRRQGVEVSMVKTGVTPTGHGGQQYQ